MPLFTHDLRRRTGSSPAKSQIESMIASCKELEEPIATIAEDGEEFGGITEDTYCYTAPVIKYCLTSELVESMSDIWKKLLDSLREISNNAATCTRDLNEDNEPFDPEDDPVSLELFRFICEHRRMLDQLMAQHHTLRWSGSFYQCIAQTLRVQRVVLEVSKHAFIGQVKEMECWLKHRLWGRLSMRNIRWSGWTLQRIGMNYQQECSRRRTLMLWEIDHDWPFIFRSSPVTYRDILTTVFLSSRICC